MNSTKAVLTGVGASDPVIITRSAVDGFYQQPFVPAGLICTLSDDADLRYIIEHTGEDPKTISQAVWSPHPWNLRLSSSYGWSTGNSSQPLQFPVTAIRVRVGLCNKGTLTFYVVQ